MTSQRHHIKTCDGPVELEDENVRFYMFARMKLGDSSMKIHQALESVYGTYSCSHDTVYRWIQCFQSGKKYLRDEPRSEAPKTAMNENAVELVRHAIADDPHICGGTHFAHTLFIPSSSWISR